MSIPSPRRSVDPPALAWGEGSLRLAEVVRARQGALQALTERLGEAAVEDVHQGRVAARRLRSILKTFAPFFDERWARLHRLDLRSFAHALGRAREADVLAGLLEETVADSDRLSPAQLQRLGLALRRARQQSREALAQRMRESSWRALVAALADRFQQSPRIVRTDGTLADVLERVERTWRKPAKRLARHPEHADALHELRLELKHCRYALEVVADLAPRESKALQHRLRRVQDTLGSHRDTLAAARWVSRQQRALGPRAVEAIEARLFEREERERRAATRQCAKLLPAYRAWREAIRPLRAATRKVRS